MDRSLSRGKDGTNNVCVSDSAAGLQHHARCMSAPRPACYAVRGSLLLDDDLVPGSLLIEAGLIVDVVTGTKTTFADVPVFNAPIVSPGFIDLQVNGGFGYDVTTDRSAVSVLSTGLPETGVTSFLPTVITSLIEEYPAIFEHCAGPKSTCGAQSVGLHLEGPLLSPHRVGAHSQALITASDSSSFEALIDDAGVRLVTLAPERQGTLELIARLRRRGIAMSLGHTQASFDEFVKGVDAGATMATHLYNAMSGFHHRRPNATGAALVDDRITVGLIADGIHCDPAALELAVRAKGPDRIALVTDMIAAAGMKDGGYTLGGSEVCRTGESVRLRDGTLAGSVLLMDQAVRNMVTWTIATPSAALKMATHVPARELGLTDRGRLAVGLRADLALLDDDLTVQSTIAGGEHVFSVT